MSDEQLVNKPRRRNTKERIVDEAETLATLHGIEHLKLQDVADKIGIKLPSVYAHFSGREDILAAMSARINKGMAQFYIAKPNEQPTETLQRSAQEVLTFLGENPAYFRLMLRDYSVPLGYDPLNHRAAVNQNFSLPHEIQELHSRIQNLLDRISLSSSEFRAKDFSASVHGYILMSLSWLPTKSSEENGVFIDHPSLSANLKILVTRLLSQP